MKLERRYYKMLVKIVCFILLAQASINFAAPTSDKCESAPVLPEDSENGSGEACCERRCKEEFLGPGIDNANVTVDVGKCVPCGSSDSSDTNQSSSNPTECGRNKTKECKPSHTSYRTYHLYNGTITKEIIKECTCQGVPSNNNCKRRKRFTTYFEGSSFEQKIDTGECVGVFQAAKGKQCIAIENRTEVISGPNGRMCVPVIKSCEFRNGCYRAPFKEQHLEIYDENGQTKQRWKTIDVGQCKGYCEPTQFSEQKCLSIPILSENVTICSSDITEKNNACVPTMYNTETFTSSPEEEKKILTITECGCKPE